jgi:hypothetical protein
VDEISEIAARVTGSATAPELLDAGFAAFELIRVAARAYEDRAPELFAAFITAAGTAAEGRNALYDAPSFPLASSSPPPAVDLNSATDPAHVADQLAALAALVARCLCAVDAALPGGLAACRFGARAASGIRQLLVAEPDECDETVLR